MIPAWSVQTWKPVVLTQAQFNAAIHGFSHVTTVVSKNATNADDGYIRCGQALWAAKVPLCEDSNQVQVIGIAFDWAEIKKGFVALVDPMTLLSNVEVVDKEGACLGLMHKVMLLNTAVYLMNWQPHAASA